MIAYDEILEANGKKLTKKYIESLSGSEREALVEPIFKIFRSTQFLYPNTTEDELKKEYQRLLDFNPDLNNNELFNNSSLGTNICKYFCKSFYGATDGGKTMEEIFYDDIKLKKSIRNRLGLEWLYSDEKGQGVNEAFNISFKMMIQSFRSQRLVSQISMFKPSIAKYMCLKYSSEGDVVGDYSCGFGGRLLGAMSCNRKYIGTDPLTTDELEGMAKFYNFTNYKLIKSGSENYCGEENSIDLYWSSPPYFDQEIYSLDDSQAYNRGENYFYDIYWKKTLQNVKFMLKPDKYFGLNVKNFPKMLSMAQEEFGEIVEQISLKTVRSHLNKKKLDPVKNEFIYMFKNKK